MLPTSMKQFECFIDYDGQSIFGLRLHRVRMELYPERPGGNGTSMRYSLISRKRDLKYGVAVGKGRGVPCTVNWRRVCVAVVWCSNDDDNNPLYQLCGASSYDIDCQLTNCQVTGFNNCTSMDYLCYQANCTTQNPGGFMILIVASLNNHASWPLHFQIADADLATCVTVVVWCPSDVFYTCGDCHLY